MYLKNLFLRNFRNYSEQRIDFHNQVNFLVGKNAQGKTNIVESIGFLSTGRSFRRHRDEDILRLGEDFFYLAGSVIRGNRELSIECTVEKKSPIDNIQQEGKIKKTIRINGSQVTKLKDLIGNFCVVVFTPDHLEIVKASPLERRRFIDLAISQVSPAYCHDLILYQKIVIQRNRLLKLIREKKYSQDTLSSWDMQLVLTGSRIIKKRMEVIEVISSKAKKIHEALTKGKEQLNIEYLTCNFEEIEHFHEQISDNLMGMLKARRGQEIARGNTLVGPHRDDLRFFINGVEVRNFASQGQQRTLVLSLKLAELNYMSENLTDKPVLLLDDVMSELDGERRIYLLELIAEQGLQAFITSADEKVLDCQKILSGSIYHVEQGQVTKIRSI